MLLAGYAAAAAAACCLLLAPAPCCAGVTAAGAEQSGRDSQRVRRCLKITSTSYELLFTLSPITGPSLKSYPINSYNQPKHACRRRCQTETKYKNRKVTNARSLLSKICFILNYYKNSFH